MEKYYSAYYYKRKRKKNKAYLSVITVIISILAIIIAIIAVSGNNSDKYSTSLNVNCYLLSIGSFDDLTSATILAENCRKKGGAGYIYKNTKYNVILSIYFEDKTAKSVLNTLINKSETATIIPLSLPALKHENLQSNEKDSLSESIKIAAKAINSMYELSNGLDTGTLTEKTVKLSLKEINVELNNIYEKNVNTEIYKENKNLQEFNNSIFKAAVSINEIMLSDSFDAKDLRFLNIDIFMMFYQ